MKYVLIAIIAYLIGSFSMSIVLTKYVYHDDVRNHGSGNAGATNVARVFGWGPGLLTFAGDFLKCVLAVWLGTRFGGEWGKCVAGIACLLGHCFPLYFRFKGGKAVTTGLCVVALIDWKLALLCLGVFVVMALLTKIVSISSVCAAVVEITVFLGLPYSLPMKVLGVFTGALILFMHRSNMKRLLRGEEKKFSPGSRKSGTDR